MKHTIQWTTFEFLLRLKTMINMVNQKTNISEYNPIKKEQFILLFFNYVKQQI